MINYILIFTCLLIGGLIFLVAFNLWKKNKKAVAVLISGLGGLTLSVLAWFIMNESAESNPPSIDVTSEASVQQINDQKLKENISQDSIITDYSEQNEKENRDAVERFKSIPVK